MARKRKQHPNWMQIASLRKKIVSQRRRNHEWDTVQDGMGIQIRMVASTTNKLTKKIGKQGKNKRNLKKDNPHIPSPIHHPSSPNMPPCPSS